MSRFDGRVAAITGGGGDIGRALIDALEREGARVAAGDVRSSAGTDQLDVTDADATRAWFDRIERDLGPATIVVANAAVVRPQAWDEITPETWREQIEVNLTGAFLTAREGAARMRRAGVGGSILFVGSWAADRPDTNIVPYCVGKAGLRMLMRAMAKELAPHGILVNEIAPGYVDAGLSAQVFRERPGTRESCEERVPVGRLISADEVAAQALHLLDPANRHVTGSVLTMDGGLSL